MEKNYTLFSAIDLGSNAARMMIVQVNKDGTYSIIEDLVKNINMGEEVFKSGSIERESLKEVCDVLNGFRNVMKAYKVKRHRVVATSALREIEDREYIIDNIQINTGFKVEVINYAQETFLKSKALREKCSKYLRENKDTLLLDIGAGGVEISFYRGKNLLSSYHIKAGALRIRKFLEELEAKTLNFDKVMQAYILSQIYTLKNDVPKKGIDRLIVIGGESRTICHICSPGKKHDEIQIIGVDKIVSLYGAIRKMLPQDIMKKYNMSVYSAEQLLPSLILIRNSIELSKCSEVIFPFVSLKEGIVEQFIDEELETQKKEQDIENILWLVKNICRKYQYDEKHADYVEYACTAVFEKTKKLHGMGQRELFLLRIAAQVHDIGKYVNIDNHYLHSFNIISSLNIVGISDNERRTIASAAKYHYSKSAEFGDDNYRRLTPKNRVLVAKLTAILQLADSIDIQHKQLFGDIDISIKNQELVLTTYLDIDYTLEEWMLKTRAPLFSNVFGLNIVFKRGVKRI